jgi:hypothetical protein
MTITATTPATERGVRTAVPFQDTRTASTTKAPIRFEERESVFVRRYTVVRPKGPDGWSLDRAETTWGMWGFTSSHRRKLRLPRSLDDRSREITLTHTPTAIAVTGQIPRGNYDMREMKRLTDELKERLFVELEATVAKRLRIPGR